MADLIIDAVAVFVYIFSACPDAQENSGLMIAFDVDNCRKMHKRQQWIKAPEVCLPNRQLSD